MKTVLQNVLLPLGAAAALALAAGCVSVEVTAAGGAESIVVENSGCYLFYCIPLFSGDPDYPNQQVCSWFTNTVKLDNNIRLLDEEAKDRGAQGVRNVASHYISEPILFLLLKREALQTSAELVR